MRKCKDSEDKIIVCHRGRKGWEFGLTEKKNRVIIRLGERMKRERNGKRQHGRNKSNEWPS